MAKEKASLYDITGDFKVLEERRIDGGRFVQLQTHSGYIVNMEIPDHTPEQDEKYQSDIAKALYKIAHPGADLSKVGKITVIL